jgi:hypothetical protein
MFVAIHVYAYVPTTLHTCFLRYTHTRNHLHLSDSKGLDTYLHSILLADAAAVHHSAMPCPPFQSSLSQSDSTAFFLPLSILPHSQFCRIWRRTTRRLSKGTDSRLVPAADEAIVNVRVHVSSLSASLPLSLPPSLPPRSLPASLVCICVLWVSVLFAIQFY